jgi:hypothetical protein
MICLKQTKVLGFSKPALPFDELERHRYACNPRDPQSEVAGTILKCSFTVANGGKSKYTLR